MDDGSLTQQLGHVAIEIGNTAGRPFLVHNEMLGCNGHAKESMVAHGARTNRLGRHRIPIIGGIPPRAELKALLLLETWHLDRVLSMLCMSMYKLCI